MRMKFELPHGFIHVHLYPSCHAFAVRATLLTPAIAVLNTLVPLMTTNDNLVGRYFLPGIYQTHWLNRSYYLASLDLRRGLCRIGGDGGFLELMSWRFIAGIGCAIFWVAVESALMCSEPRIIAAPACCLYDGLRGDGDLP